MKALRVAACAAVAGGALTAVLAWKYAPETTTLVQTPPTPTTMLLAATDVKACESPDAIRNGLNSMSAVEPAQLLTIVMNPDSSTDDAQPQTAQMRVLIGTGEPLPCACRWKVTTSIHMHGGRTITTWSSSTITTTRGTRTHEPLAIPVLRFEPLNTAMPSLTGAAQGVLTWDWPMPLSCPKPAEVAMDEAAAEIEQMIAELRARRQQQAEARAAKPGHLADGVCNLLGGSGGWIGNAPAEPDSGTESGVRR